MENNLKSHRWIPLAVAMLLLANPVFAARLHLSMSDNIRHSELIVIGDTRKGGNGLLDPVIRVSEVIKGDKKLVGKDINLRERLRASGDFWVGFDEKGIALLIPKDGGKFANSGFVEAYREPGRIKALKTLIDVVAIEDERKRILAMQKLFPGGDPDIQKSTFSELKGMRNPDNFDLLTQWFDELEPEHQAELIMLMSQVMRDRRCVPTLIKALSSPALEVRQWAAQGLNHYFPGAPGIAEAFDAHLRAEGVTYHASRYLAMRFDNPEYAELAMPRDTRRQEGQQSEKEKEAEAARKLFFELITDDADSHYYTRSSPATKRIQDAGPAESARMRKILLPFLRPIVFSDNYFYVLEGARILRALHHPDCLPALFGVFLQQAPVYDGAIREATMAIHELGEEASREAAQKFFEIFQAPKEQVTGNRAINHLLALIWLADETEFTEARKTMSPAFRQRWPSVAILSGLPSSEDEAAFLIERLKGAEKKAIDRNVQEWIVFRLGDLKDVRAVPVIAALVERSHNRPPPLILQDALTSIGGAEAEEAMLKLLTHPQSDVRRTATDIICALQGPEAMPLCRRILTEEDFGSKVDTLGPIGRHGTLEDLELLEKLCDYWNGDRSLTYHGGNAMGQIRERLDRDLSGPIVKAGRFMKPKD